MNDKWLSLSVNGSNNSLEIIGSYFDSYSLGSEVSRDNITMYFFVDDRQKVENILLDISDKYDVQYKWGSVESENWMNNWKDFFNPVSIGDEVIIIPDWDQNDYSHNYIIKICPAMAFGTGHHASTQLVVEQMLRYDVGNCNTLLDLGTGSGILSILAKKMGVDNIISIDIDSVCEDNFYENCKLSNVSGINFFISDVHNYDNYQHDIILANIDKKNIVKILDKYQQSETRALLILAGLLDSDLNSIKSCLRDCYIDNMLQKNEWISLAIKK